MHKLEKIRAEKQMGVVAFCEWLAISHNTYNKILSGYGIAHDRKAINQMGVDVFIKIHKKTGLYLDELVPQHPLLKIIRK